MLDLKGGGGGGSTPKTDVKLRDKEKPRRVCTSGRRRGSLSTVSKRSKKDARC